VPLSMGCAEAALPEFLKVRFVQVAKGSLKRAVRALLAALLQCLPK
jgi:hypothetical protein